MIGRVIRIVFFSILLLVSVFGLFGYHHIDHLAPADAGILAIIDHPAELLVKLDGAQLIRLLASPAPEGDMEEAVVQEVSFIEDPLTMGFLRYFIKKAYMCLPREWSPEQKLERQVTAFADLGFPGRILSLAARFGVIQLTEDRTEYHGYPIFLEGSLAVAFADNFAIVGPEAQVRASLDALDGSLTGLDTGSEDFRQAVKHADPQADVTLLIFGRELFRPPLAKAGRFDPRLILNAGGIRSGTVNLTIEANGVRGRLYLTASPNLDVAPLLHEQRGAFATAALAAAPQAAYLGLRLGKPTGLAPILTELYDPLHEQDRAVREMAQWLFDTLLKYLATEMAIVMPADAAGAEPVLIARIANQAEVRRILARKTTIKGVASQQAWFFAMPRQEGGKSLAEEILDLKSVEELAPLLAGIPTEQRGEISLMAKKVIAGSPDFRRDFLIDSQSIWRRNERGPVAFWHWRFAGDFLVVASTSERAEEFQRKLEASPAPVMPAGGEQAYPADGTLLAEADLTGLLKKIRGSRLLRVTDLLAQKPRVFLGAIKEGPDLLMSGEAPMKLDVPQVIVGGSWVLVFRILHGLAYAVLVLSVLMLVREIIHRRRATSRNG